MQEFGPSEQRLTREEAEAILRQWATKVESTPAPANGPTIAEIAKVLNLSEAEVLKIRGQQTQSTPPPTSYLGPGHLQDEQLWQRRKFTDISGAISAVVVLTLLVLGVGGYLLFRQRPIVVTPTVEITAPAEMPGAESAPIASEVPPIAEAPIPPAAATPDLVIDSKGIRGKGIDISEDKIKVTGDDGSTVEITKDGFIKTTKTKDPESGAAKGPENPPPAEAPAEPKG